MVTLEQLAQGLEISNEQATVIFGFIEENKVDAALQLAGDCLSTSVDILATGDGKKEIVSFVRMSSDDVATLIYDHLNNDWCVTTLASWLQENEDKIQQTSNDAASEPTEESVSDDEPYIMFYWKNGDILAAQIDGMKELIDEQGQPERYEIVPPSVDIFGD